MSWIHICPEAIRKGIELRRCETENRKAGEARDRTGREV